MVEEPVEEGRHGGGVAEEFAPVVDGSVRGQDRGRAFVAAHDHFEQIFGGGGGQLPHAEIVDDQERDGTEIRDHRFAGPIERRVGELFEQDVRFAIEDAVALLDRHLAARLRQMTFAGARRT